MYVNESSKILDFEDRLFNYVVQYVAVHVMVTREFYAETRTAATNP